jgi:hypothetical protein
VAWALVSSACQLLDQIDDGAVQLMCCTAAFPGAERGSCCCCCSWLLLLCQAGAAVAYLM